VALDLANSNLFHDAATSPDNAVPATSDPTPVTNGNKSTVENKTPGTLPPCAVDGFKEKTLTRRRHQRGQLVDLEHGYAVRFYEQGEGQRKRVQVYLGSYKELTRPQAKTEMEKKLREVNEHPLGHPQIPKTPTFRYFAEKWISYCETRKREPIKASVLSGWRRILKNHLLPLIGEVPLGDVGNKTMGSVVDRLSKKGLAPATIHNVMLVVKLVRSSVTDDEGTQLYPIKWNKKIIDAPKVDKRKQRTPSFVGEQVSNIVAGATGRMQMIAILLAATGLRMGELTGLECRHFDGESVKVEQAIWAGNGEVGTPKTENAYRTVDLHPDVAALLKQFIGGRRAGYIFATSSGKPLAQSNILRREFHPLLENLQIEPCGFHAFRRFRNTYLDNKCCPNGLIKYWMGHSAKDMTDHYNKVLKDVVFRLEQAEKMGTGFQVPKTLSPKLLKEEKMLQPGVTPLNGRQEETEAVPCQAA
jgi:integrase